MGDLRKRAPRRATPSRLACHYQFHRFPPLRRRLTRRITPMGRGRRSFARRQVHLQLRGVRQSRCTARYGYHPLERTVRGRRGVGALGRAHGEQERTAPHDGHRRTWYRLCWKLARGPPSNATPYRRGRRRELYFSFAGMYSTDNMLQLVSQSLRFIASAIRTGYYKQLFGSKETISGLVQGVVVPNVSLRGK